MAGLSNPHGEEAHVPEQAERPRGRRERCKIKRDVSKDEAPLPATHPSRRAKRRAPQDDAPGACISPVILRRERSELRRRRAPLPAAHPSRRGLTAAPEDESLREPSPAFVIAEGLFNNLQIVPVARIGQCAKVR